MYRVKPSKPVAVFGAVFGLAIVIVGAFSSHGNAAGLALFIVAGLAIVSFNLWAAFSKNGSTETIIGGPSRGGAPYVPGSVVTQDRAGSQR